MKKLTFIFLTVSGALSILQYFLPKKLQILKYILIEGSICSGVIASMVQLDFTPNLLLKNKNGDIHFLSYFLWWPTHTLVFVYSQFIDRIIRKFKKEFETDVSKINDQFYIGGRFSIQNLKKEEIKNIKVIVDLTNEIPSLLNHFDEKPIYLSFPTWDATPPSCENMKNAIKKVKKIYENVEKNQNSILVHCAYGRGRSCCMLIALLVGLEIYPNWEIAFENIKKKRPNVRLNSEMKKNLNSIF